MLGPTLSYANAANYELLTEWLVEGELSLPDRPSGRDSIIAAVLCARITRSWVVLGYLRSLPGDEKRQKIEKLLKVSAAKVGRDVCDAMVADLYEAVSWLMTKQNEDQLTLDRLKFEVEVEGAKVKGGKLCIEYVRGKDLGEVVTRIIFTLEPYLRETGRTASPDVLCKIISKIEDYEGSDEKKLMKTFLKEMRKKYEEASA
jgi:hypothetical protein